MFHTKFVSWVINDFNGLWLLINSHLTGDSTLQLWNMWRFSSFQQWHIPASYLDLLYLSFMGINVVTRAYLFSFCCLANPLVIAVKCSCKVVIFILFFFQFYNWGIRSFQLMSHLLCFVCHRPCFKTVARGIPSTTFCLWLNSLEKRFVCSFVSFCGCGFLCE